MSERDRPTHHRRGRRHARAAAARLSEHGVGVPRADPATASGCARRGPSLAGCGRSFAPASGISASPPAPRAADEGARPPALPGGCPPTGRERGGASPRPPMRSMSQSGPICGWCSRRSPSPQGRASLRARGRVHLGRSGARTLDESTAALTLAAARESSNTGPWRATRALRRRPSRLAVASSDAHHVSGSIGRRRRISVSVRSWKVRAPMFARDVPELQAA
jgi:hypothetical protein